MTPWPESSSITSVTFFKRDLIAVDMICCELELSDGQAILWHEEMKGWDAAIAWLAELPGFDRHWFAKVSQPPFEPTPHIAYEAVA